MGKKKKQEDVNNVDETNTRQIISDYLDELFSGVLKDLENKDLENKDKDAEDSEGEDGPDCGCDCDPCLDNDHDNCDGCNTDGRNVPTGDGAVEQGIQVLVTSKNAVSVFINDTQFTLSKDELIKMIDLLEWADTSLDNLSENY
jgi:hypothetical protein